MHGFLNLLVGDTTLAAYYIYPHMAKMFLIFNSSLYRKKFCPSGIIAIKFCSSCHLDKSDHQKPFAGEMVARLELAVNQFQYLLERSIEFLEQRYQKAWNALKHIQC